MKINVIGMCFDDPKYNMVFELLDEAAKDGIESDRFLWANTKEDQLRGADAYIFVEVFPIPSVCEGKLTIHILHNDTIDDIIEKLDDFEDKLVDLMDAPPEAKEEPTFVMPDNVDTPLTEAEVKDTMLKELSLTIEGNTVKLSLSDVITLNKVDKLMKEFGYKIDKVVF